jgi:hypothetical protein
MTTGILSTFPQLAHAVQPPRLIPRDGTFHLNPAEEFASLSRQVAAGEYRLRNPAADFDGLIGTFRGIGDCLLPVFHPGDMKWIDPHAEPADGDFVIVQWDPDELAGIIERGSSDPAWVAQYGMEPAPIAAKLLKSVNADWWLIERETGLELGKNRILGVVRKVLRDGLPLYEQVRRGGKLGTFCAIAALSACSQINNNAATDVYSTTVAGPVNVYTSGAPGSTLLASITVPAYQFAVPYVVTVTGNVDHHAPGVQFSGYATVTTSATPPSGWTTANQISRNASTAAADMGASIAIETNGTLTAGASTTFYLYGYGGGVSAAGAFVNIYNVNMKVEVLKK